MLKMLNQVALSALFSWPRYEVSYTRPTKRPSSPFRETCGPVDPKRHTSMMHTSHNAKPSHQISNASCLRALPRQFCLITSCIERDPSPRPFGRYGSHPPYLRHHEQYSLPSDVFSHSRRALFTIRQIIFHLLFK